MWVRIFHVQEVCVRLQLEAAKQIDKMREVFPQDTNAHTHTPCWVSPKDACTPSPCQFLSHGPLCLVLDHCVPSFSRLLLCFYISLYPLIQGYFMHRMLINLPVPSCHAGTSWISYIFNVRYLFNIFNSTLQLHAYCCMATDVDHV